MIPIITNCRLREYIAMHECFDTVRKYDVIFARENIQGAGGGKFKLIEESKAKCHVTRR
jgi:hypothetical protein